MATVYKRAVSGKIIKLGKFSDYEFVIYIGSRLYSIIDNEAEAYRQFESIGEMDVMYIGG